MKQYTYITLLLTFFTIPTLSACNSRNLDKSTETALPYETSIETSENNFTTMDTTIISEENEKNENKEYYKDNKNINLFLNNYNNSNPESPINQDDFFKYYHHGSEHDNQITVYKNDFEMVISDLATLNIYVSSKNQKSNDEYKQLFISLAKSYVPNIETSKLDQYWLDLMNDSINDVTFDEFECSLTLDAFSGTEIENMSMEGHIQ